MNRESKSFDCTRSPQPDGRGTVSATHNRRAVRFSERRVWQQVTDPSGSNERVSIRSVGQASEVIDSHYLKPIGWQTPLAAFASRLKSVDVRSEFYGGGCVEIKSLEKGGISYV